MTVAANREEMRAVLPREAVMADQLEIRFVHQRRWLHGDIPALAPNPELGHAKPLVINQGSKTVECRFIARLPLHEDCGDVVIHWVPALAPEKSPRHEILSRRVGWPVHSCKRP
jgi:hypothetical protein